MFLRLAVVFFANQIVRSGWFGRSPLCNLPTFVVCPPFASCDTGGRSFFKYDISSPLDRCFRSMGLNRVFSVASAWCARPRGQNIEEFQKVASQCQISHFKKVLVFFDNPSCYSLYLFGRGLPSPNFQFLPQRLRQTHFQPSLERTSLNPPKQRRSSLCSRRSQPILAVMPQAAQTAHLHYLSSTQQIPLRRCLSMFDCSCP